MNYQTNYLPIARPSDILIQDLNQELLIYNLKTNQIFSLNETAKIIYQACDGQTLIAELKVKYQFTDDLIFLTLDELKLYDLIENNYQAKFTGVSRREVIKKVGFASIAALPVITSLAAPRVSQAASNCASPSSAQSFDASGTCTSSCANCECALAYCVTNAVQCCSGTFSSANYNGLRIFCNC